MTSTKLIATYARVSTARQEEEQTIKNQILVLKEYAAKNGYTIVKEYTDDGWSGDMLARPSLDELRHDAKKKIWQAVLVYDPDRLARRYSYQELIMDELREAGIEIIFITVSAPKNSEDKILHGVRGLFAEYERAKIAERFRLGKLRKVKDGHMLVSEAPYGYRYVPIQNGKQGYYEVNEEEARIVKDIFSWVAVDGLTLRKIVMRLSEKGIMPKRSKRGVWNITTICRLLRNTTYIGEAKWGRTIAMVAQNQKNTEKYRKMKKTSKRLRPESEWLTVQVPAIIDKDLFRKAGEKVKDNFSFAKRNQKNDYLLTGKIFCPCGKRRSGQGRKNGTGLFYRCTDRLRSFPLQPTCFIKGVNTLTVDHIVWNTVSELMSSPELMMHQVNRLVSNGKSKARSSADEIDILEKEIEKLQVQEDRYNKAYAAGLFTLDKLQEYLLPIRGKITAVRSQILENKELVDINTTPSLSEIQEFADKATLALKGLSFVARRAIVLKVIDSVVASKEEVKINGCIPINENVVLCTADGNGLNTIRHDSTTKGNIIPFEFSIKLPAKASRQQ